MEYNMKENFLKNVESSQEKFIPILDLEYDYEINDIYELIKINQKKLITSNYLSNLDKFSEKSDEKDFDFDREEIINKYKDLNSDKFNDSLAPRYYKCEKIPFYQKNHFKAMISNKRIRLINKDFDLDLMYL